MGFVSESASSTIGVRGGEEGEISFDPVDDLTIRSLETSAKSFSESEEEKDSSSVEVSSVAMEKFHQILKDVVEFGTSTGA